MAYKKLNKSEMEKVYNQLKAVFENNEKYSKVITLVKKYFTNAHLVLVSMDSEYNDETYDNRFSGIFVYDQNDVECGLTRENREKFNIEVQNMDFGESNSDEPVEDVVLYVNTSLPDLYVKE